MLDTKAQKGTKAVKEKEQTLLDGQFETAENVTKVYTYVRTYIRTYALSRLGKEGKVGMRCRLCTGMYYRGLTCKEQPPTWRRRPFETMGEAEPQPARIRQEATLAGEGSALPNT